MVQSRPEVRPTTAEVAPTTRRALRRRRAGALVAGPEPRMPVTVRPPWSTVAIVVAISVVQPGRRGSLLLAGLVEGPTSRRALVSYGLAVAGILFAALFARTFLTLRREDQGRVVVIHQGLLRRRVLPLGVGHQVRLVAGPARRAIVLDQEGRLVGVLGSFLGFWRREDVVALVEGAGVVIGHEHRLNRPSEIEAAYPGATAWVERSKARLYGAVVPPTLAGVALLAWLLEV